MVATSLPPLPRSSPSTAPTTPPDPEEEMERDHLLEEQACKRLEQDGCPPCYPADPSFLVRDPMEQNREIISYWKDFLSSEGGVLCAQWKDWRRFRRFQERNRQHYTQRGSFAQFINAVRERRRRHYLPEDVRLHSHPEQQSQLETWVEFQDYHLHTHEELEKRVQVEAANLHIAPKMLNGAVASEAERAALYVKAYSVRLESATRRVKLHKQFLLPWIEQLRIKMVAAQSATADDASGHNDHIDTVRRTPVPGTRKMKPKTRSILDPFRLAVSKPPPPKRSLRNQRFVTSLKAESSTPNSTTCQNNTSWIPNLRVNKPQKARENTSLHPFQSQKVIKTVKRGTKSKQRADVNTHLHPIQTRKTRQQDPARREISTHSKSMHQHPPRAFITQSGRMSRRPERPGFVSYG